ncbi:hypothetical protein HYW17_02930 [Candidatus Uhrbacteria bacterium]|nr:hypothetical protein [Candidatus Uhrbacteria bacterium]
MGEPEHPLIILLFGAFIVLFFAVLISQALRGCPHADEDVQGDIRGDHQRMSDRAIRDAGAPGPDRFTGRIFIRPEFKYSDHAPDTADDLDLRRDGGTL